jgi:hypothetical protein
MGAIHGFGSRPSATNIAVKTVIIHGKKISERSPRFGRENCGLWGVTRANIRFWHGRLHDWTEWCDVHPLVATDRFPGIPQRRPDAWRWYLAQDGTRPIYLQDPEAHRPANRDEARRLFRMVPGAVAFPIREIQAAAPVNGHPNRWFVEQAGMMIAKAVLLDGFERIILNGIGCMTTLEFERAHRSILYWIAFARGRGVQVEIEGPSIFHMPDRLYAYEKFNYEELDAARKEIREQPLRDNFLALDAINQREQRRGRPIRHRLPAGLQDLR